MPIANVRVEFGVLPQNVFENSETSSEEPLDVTLQRRCSPRFGESVKKQPSPSSTRSVQLPAAQSVLLHRCSTIGAGPNTRRALSEPPVVAAKISWALNDTGMVECGQNEPPGTSAVASFFPPNEKA